jgi:hypothetical protein
MIHRSTCSGQTNLANSRRAAGKVPPIAAFPPFTCTNAIREPFIVTRSLANWSRLIGIGGRPGW